MSLPDIQSAEIIQAQVAAEVDVQISTAKKYPRDLERFQSTCTQLATIDEQVAADCLFSLPRGEKVIEGKSVRLAEIAARTYGNLRVQTRTSAIEQTVVVTESICHDLETNVAIKVENRRKILDKHGNRYNDDMITMTANASQSIAFRNAIFRIIPEALMNDIMGNIKAKMICSEAELPEKVEMCMGIFADMGVSEKQVLQAMNVAKREDLTPQHLVTLRGFASGIKNGEFSPEVLFKGLTGTSAKDFAAAAKKGGKKRNQRSAPAQAEEAPPEEPSAEQQSFDDISDEDIERNFNK